MKTASKLLFLLLPVAAYSTPSSIRDEMTSKLRELYHFENSSELRSALGPKVYENRDLGDFVKMETMTVIESIARRDLKKAITERAAEEEAKKLSWNRGGVIATKRIGKIEGDIGLWPTLEPELVRDGGVNSLPIMLRVEVLHLRW